MANLISTVLPYKVLASHVLLVILFLALIARHSWGREISRLLGRYALLLAFLVSLSAVVGSLFYSEIMGFEPCVLCWWQRVLIFPTVILLAIALYKKDRSIFSYVVPLVAISALIALYQSYTSLGGVSILPCTAVEGACSRVYVMAFGYITIPLMSLTVSLYVLLLGWANKLYKHE